MPVKNSRPLFQRLGSLVCLLGFAALLMTMMEVSHPTTEVQAQEMTPAERQQYLKTLRDTIRRRSAAPTTGSTTGTGIFPQDNDSVDVRARAKASRLERIEGAEKSKPPVPEPEPDPQPSAPVVTAPADVAPGLSPPPEGAMTADACEQNSIIFDDIVTKYPEIASEEPNGGPVTRFNSSTGETFVVSPEQREMFDKLHAECGENIAAGDVVPTSGTTPDPAPTQAASGTVQGQTVPPTTGTVTASAKPPASGTVKASASKPPVTGSGPAAKPKAPPPNSPIKTASTAGTVPAAAATDFCWRDSYGRGVGEIPGRVADCPKGYTNNGATCGRGSDDISAPSRLADCPKSYTNNGLTCGRGSDDIKAKSKVADCPSGYTNMGLTCYRPPKTYSKGCTTIFKKYKCKSGYTDNGCFCGRGDKTKSASSMKCPTGYFKSKITARCHKECPSGYTNTGEYCHRPAATLTASAMTCPKGYFKSKITARCHKNCPKGYTNTGETCHKPVSTLTMDKMVCKSNERRALARCYPKKGKCGDGDYDAGLCYKKCRKGYSGVGPVCWGQPPKGWVDCAMGAAKNSTACGLVVFDQVSSVGVLAMNVATLGASGAATSAAKGTKLASLQEKFRKMKKAYDQIKNMPKVKKASDAFGDAMDAKSAHDKTVHINSYSEADLITEEDIARMSAEIASIVDASGVSGAVAAYTYPKCSKITR